MNPMIVAGEGSTTVLQAEVTPAITEGCKKVATGAQEGITAVLPLGLGVFALIFGIRIAINFFRSLAH